MCNEANLVDRSYMKATNRFGVLSESRRAPMGVIFFYRFLGTA